MSTFSVLTMMREEAPVVQRFVQYFRAEGVAQIYIYYDGPTDHLSGIDMECVELVECDEAFWRSLCGTRPQSLSGAQEVIYMHAYLKSDSEWLHITDADEFIFGDLAIKEFLEMVPNEVEVLRVRSAEAVWGPGDCEMNAFASTYFRLPITQDWLARLLARLLYLDAGVLFRHGILSHVEGKQFIRRGTQPDKISNHDSLRSGARMGKWAHEISPQLGQMFLGHFDAVSLSRWREKWRRRYSGETTAPGMSARRVKQMRTIELALSGSEDEARQLFKKLYVLNGFQYRVLRTLGLAMKRDIFQQKK